MARIVEKTVFKFDELSEKAKDRARQWWRETDDHEPEFDDIVTVANILGIEFNNRRGVAGFPCIFYSGFSSQGDGACFEASYSYAKSSVEKVKEHAPKDEKLHRIASVLRAIQRKNFYKVEAKTKHSGHYYHSGCMDVETYIDGAAAGYELDNEVKVLLRSFADWIYKQLEDDYNGRMENEAVDESIIANEYEFNEDGTRYKD